METLDFCGPSSLPRLLAAHNLIDSFQSLVLRRKITGAKGLGGNNSCDPKQVKGFCSPAVFYWLQKIVIQFLYIYKEKQFFIAAFFQVNSIHSPKVFCLGCFGGCFFCVFLHQTFRISLRNQFTFSNSVGHKWKRMKVVVK